MRRFVTEWMATPIACIASGLLTFAGISKLLASNASTGLPLLDDAATRGAAATAELILAIWLVSGWQYRAARRAASGVFALFCGVAAWLAVLGTESCGCFGPAVQVEPIWMLAMDGFLGIALLVGSHRGSHMSRIGRFAGTATVALMAAGAFTFADPPKPEIVWLRPEQWSGRALPILDDIVASEELQDGTWTIIFYRPSCHECLANVGHYREMSRSGPTVFVSMSAADEHDAFRQRVGPGAFASMTKRNTWFMQTPAVVKLDHGVVQQVSGPGK